MEYGGGFVFYSSASDGLIGLSLGTGHVFLCKRCADEIVSIASFDKVMSNVSDLSGLDVLAEPSQMMQMIKEANAGSIVEHCKRHGLTPEAAKAKAHEFAVLWWKDKDKGNSEACSFWRSADKSGSGGVKIEMQRGGELV